MARTFVLCALFCLSGTISRAEEKPGATETVIRLALRPMPAPRPALRYLLLPELRDMEPGNPVQGYLKCFMEQHNFFDSKEGVAQREKYLAMPLADLARQDVRYYLKGPLRLADEAARLDRPDWQVLLPMKRDAIHLLLPDVQKVRTLAAALKVRLRYEIATRHFEDAVRTTQTLLALSQHLSEHPTLIAALVGMAITHLTLDALHELIDQPGAPNLYWALTALPDPFIPLRKGMQGERLFLSMELRHLDEREPMSRRQLDKTVAQLQAILKELNDAKEDQVKPYLDERVKDARHIEAARGRLVEAGLRKEEVQHFPALQVVLLDEKRLFEELRDQTMKRVPLPYWQFAAFEAKGEKKLRSPLEGFLPAIGKVRLGQARLDQRFALLRTVEALRLHAAEHGKLPARLDATAVPLPVDPISGKAFTYTVEGGTARLKGAVPRGMEKVAAYNVRYEFTLRR